MRKSGIAFSVSVLIVAGLATWMVVRRERPRPRPPDELNFLTGLPDFARVRNMLPEYLNRIALSQLDARRAQIAQTTTAEEIRKRQVYIRERFLSNLGGLPERTPLNARTVNTLERNGYKIEKVIFESQPRFYVTANLYLPTTGQPPYPAVLFPLGHEAGGKANPTWQQLLVTFAKRGYVALAWDPIGQGERVQIWNADLKKPQLPGSTTEHSILGVQCLLAGDAIARYTIWDGMRALDYLLSRPEVDPSRVACTGNSGGGTHTAYLSTLDDRIKVAMPSCYLTTWGRLLDTIGPQDAEQCIPFWIRDGLDHADFVQAFAPKPYLILSAIRDFFSITGARETYREAQHVYAMMGEPEKISMFEWDDGHGYNHERRQAAYRWLGRWLKGREDLEPEQAIRPETYEGLWCTESGQVVTSLGGETVTSLNLKRAEQATPARPPLTSPEAVAAHHELMKQSVERLTSFDRPTGSVKVTPFGQIEKENYRIEKLIYEPDPGVIIPALLFVPKNRTARGPAVIYVDGNGKAAGASPDGEIPRLVARGYVVLAVDARGWGETRPLPNDEQSNDVYQYFGHYDSAMTAILIGKTLVGMRAEDVIRGVDILAARPEVDAEQIFGFGVGSGALTLLHAAVLDERIKRVALDRMLVSYKSAIESKLHRDVFESVVPGVLKSYDLPDLAAALASRPVWVVDAHDPMGKLVEVAEVKQIYARAIEAFKAVQSESKLHIEVRGARGELGAVLEDSK
ncbi:MAG: acetylxylan esterase [Terriglobia bacterium]